MKFLIVGLVCVSAALSVGASSDDQAAQFARVAREADSVIIDFLDGRKTRSVRFSDAAWVTQVADALQSSAYEPSPHCFCISYPTISLVRGNDIILTLSVHHGEKLRIKGATGAMRDFHVGRTVGQRITALALEKKNG
jgi:hypothetical protein